MKDEQAEYMIDQYPEQPSLYDAILAGIETTGDEAVAELIETALDELNKAIRQNKDAGKKERHIKQAKAALNDIFMHDSDDPRLNGWVDDRGRP